MSETLISNFRLVTASEDRPDSWLRITDGRISALGMGTPPGSPAQDLGGLTLIPGFVDMHCHGGGGASFASADEKEIAEAAAYHLRHGTTSILASLVTDELAALQNQLKALSASTKEKFIVGAHLEGPYLNSSFNGAHTAALMRDPDETSLLELWEAAQGCLRMVTIAPELEGAIDAISWFARRGVTVAIGHTDATYEQTVDAIAAGASVATHLGNAMRPLRHRDPGPQLALVNDPRVICELIADGSHLHEAYLAFVIATAQPHRIALISDCIPAAGCGDTETVLGSTPVKVQGGIACVRDSGALAGSTLTMHQAFVRTVQNLGVSLQDAVQVTSSSPAAALGMKDAGDLAVHMPADAVLLKEDLSIAGVMSDGEWIDLA